MADEVYVDLHTHTVHSDGTLSAEDVVKNAALSGTQILAITDHDTLAGWKSALPFAREWGITLVPGVEVTTSKYHILGLGVAPEPGFLSFLEESVKSRYDRMVEKVNGLRELGWPIAVETVEAASGYCSYGTLNIFTGVMQDSACRDYFQRKGMTVQDFKTLIREVPAKFRKHRSGQAIRAIHDAGGLAVLAHPFKDASIEELEILVAKGLDGVEVQPNYGERNRPFEQYAREKGLLITYGSDFHTPVKRPLLGAETRNGYAPKMRLEDVARLRTAATFFSVSDMVGI